MQINPGPHDRRTFLAVAMSAAAGLALRPTIGLTQDLTGLTLKRASELLRTKAASCFELTQAFLRRIEEYNPTLNALITVTAEQALTTARELDAERQRGKWRGLLHGIPITVKDNIDTGGIRTTAASELFKDRIPSEDAEVVRRLKQAGAVLLGKTNLHEFAYGGSSSVSYFNAVRNPWALDRIPGGSSGGSAAATAFDLCVASVGTDTAGSVRIPAAYCGIVGLKPTYGRVSNRGVVPLSWTLDHVGPLCKTVEDAALMLGVMAGFDERDPTAEERPVPDYRREFERRATKLRLGVVRAPFFEALDPEIANAIEAAIEKLRERAASIRDVQLSPPDVPFEQLYAKVRSPESYAYHSRWIKESPEKYQPSTRERILQGTAISAADYAQARRQIDQLRRSVKDVFRGVDVLITPTMPNPPVRIADAANLTAVSIRNTCPFSVLGLPTISVPCGFTRSGLPVGLQMSGAPFAESTLLAIAHAYEQATDWHDMRPKLKLP